MACRSEVCLHGKTGHSSCLLLCVSFLRPAFSFGPGSPKGRASISSRFYLDAHVPSVPRPVTPYDLLTVCAILKVFVSLRTENTSRLLLAKLISETNSYRSGLFVAATKEDNAVRSLPAARGCRIGPH